LQTGTSDNLMPKSPDAFRTISEVAEWLEIQAHVLRFWESKFTQVKPIKRAGGRRYYRPNDMLLLGGIKRLLHEDGLTIKGVQKVLREEGMGHVAALSAPLEGVTPEDLTTAGDTIDMAPMHEDAEQPHEGVVLAFESRAGKASKGSDPQQTPVSEVPEPPTAEADTPSSTPPVESEAPAEAEPTPSALDKGIDEDLPSFLRHPMTSAPVTPSDNTPDEAPAAPQAAAPVEDETAKTPAPSALPPEADIDHSAANIFENDEDQEEPLEAGPKPRVIDLPPLLAEDAFPAKPSVLSAALMCRNLPHESAQDIAPLLNRLAELRDSMRADVLRRTKV